MEDALDKMFGVGKKQVQTKPKKIVRKKVLPSKEITAESLPSDQIDLDSENLRFFFKHFTGKTSRLSVPENYNELVDFVNSHKLIQLIILKKK